MTRPSTEEVVLAAEERLGVRLPPSYRNFLADQRRLERHRPFPVRPAQGG
ncbi:MAG TPA: SMI1/KNR4 family protein [Umezawaea sp.]|nr:SMI1/KNR4 family protein [Umezawaea sp.]